MKCCYLHGHLHYHHHFKQFLGLFHYIYPLKLNRVKLYADDVLLYANIDSESDCDALQQDLDSLVQWSHSCLILRNVNL